jgi:hypothetical protein
VPVILAKAMGHGNGLQDLKLRGLYACAKPSAIGLEYSTKYSYKVQLTTNTGRKCKIARHVGKGYSFALGGLGAVIITMLKAHLHRQPLSVRHGNHIAVDRHRNYVLVKREDHSEN